MDKPGATTIPFPAAENAHGKERVAEALDGVLFIDHLTSLKRNMILRKLTKLKKEAAADK